MNMQIPEVTVTQLKQELDSEAPPTLIDVREADELEISRFPKYRHIPMRELVARIQELDAAENMVIVCRSGNRSGQVTAYLARAGFTNVRNLVGGINEWARIVDPSLARY